MDLKKGDRVLVNLAPFVGLVWRSKESIPCRVVGATNTHVEVMTEYPYREFSLWVQSTWIDGCLEGDAESCDDGEQEELCAGRAPAASR
jgi:hypothetical protein